MTDGRAFAARCALALGAALATASCASAPRAECSAPPGSRCIVANPHYAAGPGYRTFFGSGYREVWTTPVAIPLLDLDRTAGGLRPVKRVGSLQSQGLALAGADGRAYTFRSSDKDNARVLSGALQAVPELSSAYRDQASAAHPGAPVVVGPLAAAAGVLQPSPRLVVMPDDPRLGEFADFANRLGTFEEFPTPAEGGRKGTFGALEIIDSEELWQRLDRDPAERVDARAYLRARLFDFVIGDVDRHPRQWRWARLEPGGAWQPVAEDRDFAFSRFGGLAIATARPFRPLLAYYDEEFRVEALLRQAVGTDPRLLAPLPREVWREEVAELKRRLTPERIAAAVRELPETWRRQTGAELAGLLAKRVATLEKGADAFYAIEAEDVEIHATAAPETVTVLDVGEGAVEIAVSAAGETVPHFRRRFAAAETGVVRLCGFDGRDRVASLEAAIDVERLDVCIPEREVAASQHGDDSPDDGSPDD
jgi:hypothetical protein